MREFVFGVASQPAGGDFWAIAASVAGLAGVACFVFYGLFRDWLRVPALATLTRQQKFILFILFLTLTFLFAVAALGAYLIERQQSHRAASAQKAIESYEGYLRERHQVGRSMLLARSNAQIDGARSLDAAAIEDCIKRYDALFASVFDSIGKQDLVRAHQAIKDIQAFAKSNEVRQAFTTVTLEEYFYFQSVPNPDARPEKIKGVRPVPRDEGQDFRAFLEGIRQA